MSKLGKFLKILLIIGIVLLIPLIGVSPFLLNHTRSYIYSMFVMYPNGVLALIFVYEFIKLFKSLEDNNPFCYENVTTLKRAGIISLLISILWFIDLLFMVFIMNNTYINYVIVLVFLGILFFGVSVALYILSELFKQATDCKIENDLTI